jgi:hypothetical protein
MNEMPDNDVADKMTYPPLDEVRKHSTISAIDRLAIRLEDEGTIQGEVRVPFAREYVAECRYVITVDGQTARMDNIIESPVGIERETIKFGVRNAFIDDSETTAQYTAERQERFERILFAAVDLPYIEHR